jgi:hypothetical protein
MFTQPPNRVARHLDPHGWRADLYVEQTPNVACGRGLRSSAMKGRSLIAIGAALAAAAIGADPVATADDVPGIDDDAVLGAPCANSDRYIFGRGPSGEPLACVAFDGDGQWVRSMPLVGVRGIGSPCVDESSGVAQSPDGRGLLCVVTNGWQPGP